MILYTNIFILTVVYSAFLIFAERLVFTYNSDFYYLALQTCSDETHFTIHGLWPNYANGTWPEYCYKANLDIVDLENNSFLLEEMNDVWPSCPHNNIRQHGDDLNYDFWDHEIYKHYTCLFDQDDGMSQNEYFETAINMYFDVIDNPTVMDYYCYNTDTCKIPFKMDFETVIYR